MRFAFAESMTDPSYYLPLARAAEEAGFDGFIVPDSICYPEVSDSTYPYTPDGKREFLEDKPFIEPFTLIPAMAAVTERLTFTTFVVKLPIRNPVLVAKSAASVAVMSDNRFNFGVGTSPWPDDYEICGVPWERRGKRMDEMIDIVQGLGTGEYFSYDGEIFTVPSAKICPVPTRPLPIMIGGHGEKALRRAARLDGWLHAGGDPEQLDGLLGRLTDYRRELGREDAPFSTFVISIEAYSPEGIEKLEARGITDVIVGFRDAYAMAQDTQSLDEKIGAIQWYADEVITKVR